MSSKGKGKVVKDTRESVVLTMPRYGSFVHPAAMRSLYQASSQKQLRVETHIDVSQSICYAFNIALAQALDWRDHGMQSPHTGGIVKPRYWGMLHADIEAQPGWLDMLYARMVEHKLVAIAAVSPIKDPNPNPRTSTAFGRKGETWFPVRYVHVNDRKGMPDTFTPEDVCKEGEELLINTGVMLLDLQWPHWDDFSWQLDSRIVRTPSGTRVVQMRSEDWMMARYLNAHGARYGATWGVPLKHYGEYAWFSHVEAA